MDEWLAAVKNELDFRHEGRNLVRMKQAMKESGLDVLIPDVVPEFTSKKVVVMSFCEGVKVTEPKLLTMDASIREAFMHTVCESFAYQMHIEGLFHGDAHPGNILVQVRGNGEGGAMHARPVLLDWGLTKELTTPMRLAFSKFVYSASEMDIVSMLESFEDLGVKLNRFNPAEDMQNIMFILRDTAAPEEARKQMKGFRRVAKARRAAGLKNPVDAYPGDLLFFMRATTMLRALCTLMHTKLPYMAIMAPYARRALMESVPQEERAIHFIYQSPVLSSLETRLRRKLEALNDEGLIGGCQVSVMRMGVRIVDTCVGVQGPVDPRPVTPRSLFCCFSVGKAIASLALHMLLDGKGLSNEAAQNGWLSEGVDTPVAKFWPEFGKHGKQHCTIRHILTHSCGLQHVFAGGLDDFVNWDKMLHLLEEATPLWPPGKRSSYHYFTYGWLVGGCVERLSGSKFSDFVKHFIAHPLGLVDHIFMGDLQARGIEDERLATVEHSMFKEVAASSMDEFERAARVDSADTPMEDGSDISDGDGRLQKDAMENGTFLDMMARAVAEDDPIEGSALEDLARSLRGKEFMLDPRLYNWKKMRNACIPSANGFFTASGLCTIFSDMLQSLDSGGVLLSRKAVDELRKFQVEEESALHRLFGLPNGVRYGLGFQLFGFREKYIDSSSESIRKRVRLSGFGHSGVNGSLVVADAATGVSIAITLNKIVSGRRATSEILSVVCKELQMGAPCSVFAGGM
jgi:CubicO group peptidase (beta-lactamase class C family)/tRNA A-37 threonylcarbamoyl transferase component Bud32